MTESEIIQAVEQRIRDRFAAVQVRGGGAVTVTGTNGSFSVSLERESSDNEPNQVFNDPGKPPFQSFPAGTGGFASLRINWVGAINNIPWSVPSSVINLGGGKKIYARVGFAFTTASFIFRPDPDADPDDPVPDPLTLLSAITISSAEILVVPLGTIPPKDDDHIAHGLDTDHPGSYTVHAMLAVYDDDGNEAPPYPQDNSDPDAQDAWTAAEVTGNAFQSGVYGWSLQNAPYQPFANQTIGILTLPRA